MEPGLLVGCDRDRCIHALQQETYANRPFQESSHCQEIMLVS
ncbi:MAG: hypothetical protein AAFX95_06625 [Cyanobacteria bacterium J06639_16]